MSLEPSLTRARGSRPIGPSLTRARGSRPIGPSLAPAVLSLLACFAFSVCGATAGDGIGEAKGGDESGRRDALGFPLKPGPPPRAIVSLSPNLTEMLFALGVRQERIAGVTRFCDYPEEARALPRIGGIVDPSVEGILAVGPDLVLATRGNPTAVLDRLRAAGVRVYAFESTGGLAQILDTMRTLEEIVTPDDTTMARAELDSFAVGLARLREASAAIPIGARPSVYYYDPVSPEWTAGPGTHVDEAIDLAGGRNAVDDAAMSWPRIAVEALLARQPDLILVSAPGNDTSDAARAEILRTLEGSPGWRGLSAVRRRRICMVPADWLMRPGPRVLWAVERLATCLERLRAEGRDDGRKGGIR